MQDSGWRRCNDKFTKNVSHFRMYNAKTAGVAVENCGSETITQRIAGAATVDIARAGAVTVSAQLLALRLGDRRDS